MLNNYKTKNYNNLLNTIKCIKAHVNYVKNQIIE